MNGQSANRDLSKDDKSSNTSYPGIAEVSISLTEQSHSPDLQFIGYLRAKVFGSRPQITRMLVLFFTTHFVSILHRRMLPRPSGINAPAACCS